MTQPQEHNLCMQQKTLRRGRWRVFIRQLAEAKGISDPMVLATLVNVSVSEVIPVWNDWHADISLSLLERLAEALGVTLLDALDASQQQEKQ